jgi:alpha-galactosidase/6-phospho-beta-glucosidase family protein
MGDRFKLAYIGAGSFRFSLGFFRNIVNATELLPFEVALCDIDAYSLSLVTKILKRMVKTGAHRKHYRESDILVTSSTDREASLENADFVYKSISVGLQAAEWFDLYLPLKFGIPQNTGDTVGPGGLFRGLRSAPVCAAIARDMKKLCPKAPLLNYTNPVSSCTLAARTAAPDVQFIGLCHELFNGMKVLRRFYNKRAGKGIKHWRDIRAEYAGLNHFGWLTGIEYGGEDLYPVLRENAHQLVLDRFRGRDAANGFNFYLLEKTGCFPYPGARHVAEFLPEYYNAFNHEKQNQCRYWSFPEIRSVWRVHSERRLVYSAFRLWAYGLLPALGPKKEGEWAMEMTIDWRKDQPNEYVVNIPNRGTVPELPDNCIVEVPGHFVSGDLRPLKKIHVPRAVKTRLIPHCEQQPLTVAAALGNDVDLVMKAMLHDPMNRWIEDDERIEYLTNLMLFYEQKWLPKKWQEWIPKREELQKSRYWISPSELSTKDNAFLVKKYPPRGDLKSKAFFWQD